MDTIKFTVNVHTNIGIANKNFEDRNENIQACARDWYSEMKAYIVVTNPYFPTPVTIEKVEIVFSVVEFEKVVGG